jgi:hypothetical protein
MLIFWKVRFFDKQTRTFGDRSLLLNTQTLDPPTRAAIEFLAESGTRESQRELIRLRQLFIEQDWQTALHEQIAGGSTPRFVHPRDYLEDEQGKEISLQQLGPLLTGDPDAMLVPSGAQPHDIELMKAERVPIPLQSVTLTADELRILAYFARDFRELDESAFRKVI